MKQSAVQSTSKTWFAEKEHEAATPSRRGKKRAPVDKERLELCRRVLFTAHDRLRTWEAVANFYGLSKAAAYRIAKDNTYRPSKAMLNAIIEAGLPMPRRVWIDPCPDCGSVHHARCNGHAGEAVVLGEGERIVRPSKKSARPRYYRPCLPVEIGEQVKLHGIDVEAVLRQAIKRNYRT